MVRIKVFTDDLGAALQNAFDKGLNIDKTVPCQNFTKHIEKYFQIHFDCSINEEQSQIELQACQKENDTTWLTFAMNCPQQWHNIKIKADFFMELFPTQSNVFNIQYEQEKRYFRIVKAKKEKTISF